MKKVERGEEGTGRARGGEGGDELNRLTSKRKEKSKGANRERGKWVNLNKAVEGEGGQRGGGEERSDDRDGRKELKVS